MLLSTWVSPLQLVEDANSTLRSNTWVRARVCVYIILVIKGVMELQSFWQGQFGRHRNSAIWQAVPHCLMCVKEMLEPLWVVNGLGSTWKYTSECCLSGWWLWGHIFLRFYGLLNSEFSCIMHLVYFLYTLMIFLK